MNSSHDVHVNSYWMAHAELRNHHNILIWTQAEWMAHVELLNCHSILSWTSKWLMLDYEIITAFSRELLLNYSFWKMNSQLHSQVNACQIEHVVLWIIAAFSRELLLKGSCWTTESKHYSHVNFPWIAHVELWNHHSILSWALPEWLMLDYGLPQQCHMNSFWMND
jgi:hypothetical protein